jgi:hypothetical protein
MSKKALLIGINYVGTSSALNGCINDVTNMKAYLLTKGYSDANITVLTDETNIKPTRANILNFLLSLILSDANTLFFHYSGHGTFVTDENGDETDGKDECICPIDYTVAGMVLDDEIRGLLQCLNTNKSMTIILDSCYSGSASDLCWNLYERAGKYSMIKDTKQTPTRGKVVMLSGCRDDQTSADAYIAGTYQGALTNSFLSVVNSGTPLSYDTLVRQLRLKLKSGQYSQIPCLSSGKSLILTSLFTV